MIWHSARLRLCSFQWKNTERNHGKGGARKCVDLIYFIISCLKLQWWHGFSEKWVPLFEWMTFPDRIAINVGLNHKCSITPKWKLVIFMAANYIMIPLQSNQNPIIIPSQSFSHSIPCYIFLDRYFDIFWNHLPACFFAITILKEDHLGWSHPKGFLFI